jgi:hypothetical protein
MLLLSSKDGVRRVQSQEETKISVMAMPSRLSSYVKIEKVEYNAKIFISFCITEIFPIAQLLFVLCMR